MDASSRFSALRRAALALLALAPAAYAAPFSLLRDTVDLRTQASLPAFDLVTNAGADSIVFDSLSARLVSNNMPAAQIVFYLQSGAEPTYTLNKSFNAYSPGGSGRLLFIEGGRFAVKAQTTARMANARFDECVYCPTAKRSAAQGALALGDTIKAWVRFHSGPDTDSVLFLSRHRTTSSILPSANLRPAPGAAPPRPVDAAGRALRAPARHTLAAPVK
jgi:hypothetical protein